MARGNTTSGSDASGVGQRYSVPVVGGSGDSTKPFSISWSFNLSGLDTTNVISWIDKSSSASTGSGFGQGLTITQNSIDIYLHDDHGSGWGHFRQVQYRMQAAPSPLVGTYPFPDPGVTYVYTLVVDSATGTTDYSADDPADTNYTTVDLYMSHEGGTPQTWTPEYNDAGASMNGTNGVFDEQVLFASSSLNKALQGSVFSFASWVGRALNLDEITALHKGYSPLHFRRGLYIYNDQIRKITSPAVRPSGLTITDANATIVPHDIRTIPVFRYLPEDSALPGVDLSIGYADAVTEHGPDFEIGDVLNIGYADAVTEHGPAIVTGYASPILQIRDAIADAVEALTTPDLSGQLFVHAGALFRLPEGIQGHRMFRFEEPTAAVTTEFGTTSHQVEHSFVMRCRICTSTDTHADEFSGLVSEAVTLIRAIDGTSLAAITGAQAVITDGYRTEPTESDDTDIITEIIAYTTETS